MTITIKVILIIVILLSVMGIINEEDETKIQGLTITSTISILSIMVLSILL